MDEMRQGWLMWKRERGGWVVGGGISEEEMRIQKGGHHSDSHLFSFSSCMRARALHLHRAFSVFMGNKRNVSPV